MSNNEKIEWEIVVDKEGQITTDFESAQNLIGAFSILLRQDKKINPQNYVVTEGIKQ